MPLSRGDDMIYRLECFTSVQNKVFCNLAAVMSCKHDKITLWEMEIKEKAAVKGQQSINIRFGSI